jgi:uncharacterized protein YodC (DUF2158 family)
MSEGTLQVGTQVKLKSGGPEMTVQLVRVSEDGDVTTVRCQWFAGKKLEDGIFPADSLNILETTK